MIIIPIRLKKTLNSIKHNPNILLAFENNISKPKQGFKNLI